MAKIQNVAYADIIAGNHIPVEKGILIQIMDHGMEYPVPKCAEMFEDVLQMKFMDVDERADPVNQITSVQARAIFTMLKKAVDEDRDVIVHCIAGVCRSGAVAEAGIMMGLEDGGCWQRIPNVLVKKKLLVAMGWSYENT